MNILAGQETVGTKVRKDEGRELGRDLASFLQNADWMVWTQIPLGPVGGEVFGKKLGIADVIAVAKSFSNVRVNVYEVKISRSDYLRDVNKGKYLVYLTDCTQFYFAAPSGLIKKQDLPEGCGLIVRTDDHGWHVIKAPPRREFKWTETLLLKLLMRGYEDYFPKMRVLSAELFENQKELVLLAHGRGAELARRLASAEGFISEVEACKKEIEKAVGREFPEIGLAIYHLRGEVNGLLQKREFSGQAVKLADLTMSLFNGHFILRDGVVMKLRQIADEIEAVKLKEEKWRV